MHHRRLVGVERAAIDAVRRLAHGLQTGANMNKLTRWSGCLLFTGVMLAVACGDDDDDDDDDNTQAGAAGTRNQAGSGGKAGGGSGGSTSSGTSSGGSAVGGSASGGSASGGAPGDSGGMAGADTDTAGAAGGDLGGAAGMGGAGGAAALELSDAQIVLVLDTLNQGEVDVAYAALPHLALPEVQTFAQQMITEHTAARQQVLATANTLDLDPKPSSVEQELRREAEMQVEMLHGSDSDALDEAYVESQVAAHAEALTLLATLQEAADAGELQELITALTAAVQTHYDEAVALQADIE